MKTLVLYHAHCNDGFGAAWVARRHYGKAASYQAIQYGQQPPPVEDRDVLILDFSFPRRLLLRMHEKARSLLVLDHHVTAQEDLEGLEFARFDLERSGATMTWDHFFPGEPRPWLLEYVEDRDLWQWKLPHSEEVAAALQSYVRKFEVWDGILERGAEALITEGEPILRYKRRLVDAAASRYRLVEFEGYTVPCITSCILQSEIGGRLAKKYPFILIQFEMEDRRIYSLRSHAKKGADVGSIARRYGGGGHRNAAGFTVYLDDEGNPRDGFRGPRAAR
jgi:oligoribonuclease NrnB/cAMP/cGMP phosphodiesterase (DHH superfamily)